jgi:hypothetical protein
MTEDQKRMFGMSTDDIREQYMNSITAKLSGLEMVVASILSDCQEELDDGDERIRKRLNVAKFILFEMMEKRRDEEMVLVNSDGKEIA